MLYSSAKKSAKPERAASIPGVEMIMAAMIVEKSPPIMDMRQENQRLKSQRCQDVVVWLSIKVDIEFM